MFCQSCGMEVASTYKMCPKCGSKQLGAEMPRVVYPQPIPPTPPESNQPHRGSTRDAVGIQAISRANYASFWFRLGAYLIDCLLLYGIPWILLSPMIVLSLFSEDAEIAITLELIAFVIGSIVALLYFPLMHSSKYQATLGKKWLGIKVVDESGQRISFARAFGRYLASILSYLTFYIGFLMIFFTERRQALHDKIAKTYVIHSGR